MVLFFILYEEWNSKYFTDFLPLTVHRPPENEPVCSIRFFTNLDKSNCYGDFLEVARNYCGVACNLIYVVTCSLRLWYFHVYPPLSELVIVSILRYDNKNRTFNVSNELRNEIELYEMKPSPIEMKGVGSNNLFIQRVRLHCGDGSYYDGSLSWRPQSVTTGVSSSHSRPIN